MSLLLQFGNKAQSLLHSDLPSSAGSQHVDSSTSVVEHSEPYTSRLHTITGCFGLPYQDHNYGAPPPPTPPMSPSPPSPPAVVKVNGHIDIDDVSCHTTIVTSTEDQDIVTPEDSVTRCICEFQHDDGYMICCDRCGVWQHVDCMAVDRLNIPEIYFCEKCEPRKVDKHRAIQLQTKRRELLIQVDSSATDTEDETQEGKKKKKDKAKQKKNKKDKKENSKVLQMKGKLKFPPKPKPKFKDNKEVKRLPSVEENSSLPLSNKKKNQVSPLLQKKKKIPKQAHRTLSLDTSQVSDDLMHGGWSSPEGGFQNGLLSPPLAVPSVRDVPSASYKEAQSPGNQYSIEIETLLVGNKLNGQHKALSPRDVLATPKQLLVQLCKVMQVNANHKGLEALDDIATNQPIIEYKGSVMMKDQFMRENNFYTKPHPSVLFYKYDDLQLCVDASKFNSDACYVRRSCAPNTEVRHVVEQGNLHFYLYSSRCISKGAELTIPFDFTHKECNYNVECACSRQSCPIAKHHKNEDGRTPIKMIRKRRRRSTKSEDTTAVINIDSIPISTSTPVHNPTKSVKSPGITITKRRKLSSFSESAPTVSKSPEKTPEPKPSPPKTRAREESLQAAAAAAAAATATATAVAEATTATVKVEESQETDKNLSGEIDVEDHTEEQKKMTREERKMDAILKAFEKMEKREERRKEALARIDHTRKSRDSESKPTVESEVLVKKEKIEVTTEEDIKPEKIEIQPKKGKSKGKKRRMSMPARRQSRAGSALSAFDSGTSADECSITTATPLPTPLLTGSEPGSSTATPSCANSEKAFRFPKTKKYRLNEWLHENGQDAPRPLSIKTDLSDIDSEEAEFVKCVPSPHANSLSHLRRNSMSAANRDNQGKAVGSAGVQLDSNIGSAKKRWLRQAMFEHTGAPGQSPTEANMSPIQSGSTSPNPVHAGNGSPGTSPLDFVTPLKKRRMARESVSSESPYPGNSSLSPYPGLDPSDLVAERLEEEEEEEEEEDDIDEEDRTHSDHEDHVGSMSERLHKKLRNGMCAQVSSITPIRPRENVFELMGKNSDVDLHFKHESLDSSFSESVLSPDRKLPSATAHSVKEEVPNSDMETKPHVSGLKIESKHSVSFVDVKTEFSLRDVSVGKDLKPVVKEEAASVDSMADSVVKQECDTEMDSTPASAMEQDISKSRDLYNDMDSGLGLGPSTSSDMVKSELSEASNSIQDKSDHCVDVSDSTGQRQFRKLLPGIQAISSSCVKKAEDFVQPSSSSDPEPTGASSKCRDCADIQSQHIQSNSFKTMDTVSAHDSVVDSSEPQSACCRTVNIMDSTTGSEACVKQSVDEQEECDSTNNREVGFEGSHRADNSEVGGASCSSSELDTKEVPDVKKSTWGTELSSSSQLGERKDTEVVGRQEADSGLASSPSVVVSAPAPQQSHLDVSSDTEHLCSSSNAVEMISNSASHPANQIGIVSDTLDPEVQRPTSGSMVSELCGRDVEPTPSKPLVETSDHVQCSSLMACSASVNSSAQVDSTQANRQEHLFSPSRSRKEDGELDSSMSDMERDPRFRALYGTCKAESSGLNEAEPQSQPLPLVEESEKEEGEITDDETEEESAIDPPVPPPTSTSSPVSTGVATVNPTTSTESVPTSSVSGLKLTPSELNATPSSSSSVFRWPFASGKDRSDQDWGTPYRGSSNNNISSSSGSSRRDRDRYSDYHPSHRHCRSSRSYDQRSPTRDDSYFVDSSSSERSRHHSDDSNSNGIDNNISSTGCDHMEESWRSTRRGSFDTSPTGLLHDNSSPISSSGLACNLLQPATKKKMSLTEYKKRMKQKRPEPSRSSSAASRHSSNNSGRSTPVAKEPNNTDLITPLLPYFGTLGSSLNKEKAAIVMPAAALPSLKDPKEESDVQWNACATTAERIREQTQLSLTERLRREFGLDASESEEDDEKRKERLRHSSGGRPSSPAPPPPPPPVSASHMPARRDSDDDVQLPPPPPPVSYPQHTYNLPPGQMPQGPPPNMPGMSIQPGPNQNMMLGQGPPQSTANMGSGLLPNQPPFSVGQPHMAPPQHGHPPTGPGPIPPPRGIPMSMPQHQQQHMGGPPPQMPPHSAPRMQSGPMQQIPPQGVMSMQCRPPGLNSGPPIQGGQPPPNQCGPPGPPTSNMHLQGPPQPVPPHVGGPPQQGPPPSVPPPTGGPPQMLPPPGVAMSGGPPMPQPSMPPHTMCVGSPHVSQASHGMMSNQHPCQPQPPHPHPGQPQHVHQGQPQHQHPGQTQPPHQGQAPPHPHPGQAPLHPHPGQAQPPHPGQNQHQHPGPAPPPHPHPGQAPPQQPPPNFGPFDHPPPQHQMSTDDHEDPWELQPGGGDNHGGSIPPLMSLSFPKKQYNNRTKRKDKKRLDRHCKKKTAAASSSGITS